jgi:hypothetical protein
MPDLTITKSRSSSIFVGYRYKYDRLDGSSTSGSTIKTQVQTDTFTGMKNPKHKEQIELQQNATTPMSGIEYRTATHSNQSGPSEIQVIYNQPSGASTGRKTYHEMSGYLTPFHPTDAALAAVHSYSAYNGALSLFHTKANSALAHLQAGVIAGEWGETTKLLKTRSKSVYQATTGLNQRIEKYIRQLRRLGLKRTERLRKLLGHVSDLWLENAFAIQPLVNDIENTIEYFNDASKDLTAKIRAINDDNWDIASPKRHALGNSGAQISYLWRRKYAHEILIVGQVGVDDISSLEDKKLGIHLSDLAPTIYELIPYSFLIDYFANINAIIAGVSNLSLSVKWASMTQRKTSINTYSSGYPQPYAANVYPGAKIVIKKFAPQNVSFQKKYVVRTPLSSVAIPSLVFSLPGSTGKWLNIAALATASEGTRRAVSRL